MRRVARVLTANLLVQPARLKLIARILAHMSLAISWHLDQRTDVAFVDELHRHPPQSYRCFDCRRHGLPSFPSSSVQCLPTASGLNEVSRERAYFASTSLPSSF